MAIEKTVHVEMLNAIVLNGSIQCSHRHSSLRYLRLKLNARFHRITNTKLLINADEKQFLVFGIPAKCTRGRRRSGLFSNSLSYASDKDGNKLIFKRATDLSDSRLLLKSCRISSSSLLLLLLDGFSFTAVGLPSLAFPGIYYLPKWPDS